MSDPNYTHIVMLVDASGSMESTKSATIDGINGFIASQKTMPQAPERQLSIDDDMADGGSAVRCTATLITFSGERRPHNLHSNVLGSGFSGMLASSGATVRATVCGNGEPGDKFHYSKLFENTDILGAPDLSNDNYDTYGGTPLIDAFCKAIGECNGFIHRLPENQRPGRIIFVSYTDGEENISEKFTKADLKTKIEDMQKLNWQFVFLGANQDAIMESQKYGVMTGQSLTYEANEIGIANAFNMLSSNITAKRSVAPTAMFACAIGDSSAMGSTNTRSPNTQGTLIGMTTTDYNLMFTPTIQTAVESDEEEPNQ